MKIEKNEFSFESSLQSRTVKGLMYTPVVKANIKAIFQIAHGMAEHKERYDEFCRFMAENGYAVFVHDHIGHGESVNSDDELGFFGESGGYKNLVEDCFSITKLAREQFGAKPVIIFGHSMGSFVAREYTRQHGLTLSGAIYCGTSGANPAAGIAVKLADYVAKSKGNMHRSEFINTLAFGAYNKKIKPKRTEFDWLSTDTEEVDKYIADKYCGYLFTACGYRDLFSVLKAVSGKKWYKSVRSELPILLVSGDEDPVGEYGNGVKQVYNDLKKTEHSDVTLKLYKGARHEILNDTVRGAVMKDVLDWTENIINK